MNLKVLPEDIRRGDSWKGHKVLAVILDCEALKVVVRFTDKTRKVFDPDERVSINRGTSAATRRRNEPSPS